MLLNPTSGAIHTNVPTVAVCRARGVLQTPCRSKMTDLRQKVSKGLSYTPHGSH